MPIQPIQTGGVKLRGAFQYFQGFGLQDFWLPSILIFTLLFAILQKVKIFTVKKEGSEEKIGDRRINGILAIVISMLITIPHVLGRYPVGMDPVALISSYLPATVTLLAAVLVVILLLGLGGAKAENPFMWLIGLVSVGFLLFIFALNTFPTFWSTFNFLRQPDVQAILIVLLTMGLIGYFVLRPEPKEKAHDTISRWVGDVHPKPK